MSARPRRALGRAGLLLSLCAAGCGDRPAADEADRSTAAAEQPSPAPSGAAAAGASSAARADGPLPPDTAGWTIGEIRRAATVERAVAVLREVRPGAHPGFERLTLDLGGAGSGFPALYASYVDKPLHECGSGEEVHPVGDAWLELRLEPLDAHADGRATVPHDPRDLPELANMRRLYLTCDFEAVVTLVVAVGSPNRFRVLTLDDPRRIVLDIQR